MTDYSGQTFFQFSLLEDLVYFCDARGLAVPGDSMAFRKYFQFDQIVSRYSQNNDGWPHEQVIPLMALAQHHGIPTRLLDWTSNSYVAAYFAALDVIKGGQKFADKKLAIFGFTFSPRRQDLGRLIKLTLPHQLAGELLIRCDIFGISAASIFPGYDGAANAALELALAKGFNQRIF